MYKPVIFAGDPVDLAISREELRRFFIIIRKENHLSQHQMSDISGLSVSAISGIETSGNPTLKSVIKYLDALGYELSIRKKLDIT